MAAVVVAGLLTAIALPSYRSVIERQKVSKAIADLALIAMSIEKYRTQHFEPPATLADIDMDTLKDPWDRPYRYLNFAAGGPGVMGQIRKDHNLHPINSEFDLYSMGRDGATRPPLTAPVSRDDVVLARDGGFIGVATDF
jgi:general secretion pathway protein G